MIWYKGGSIIAQKKTQFKIVFAGLDNSGKTSILYALEDKFSLLNPSPTMGIERDTFEALGFPITRWDLGGQTKFRATYLGNERTFADTDLMFFILDIQDRSRFGDAGEYYEHILGMFEKLNQDPPIILCFHKADPDLKEDDRILSNIQVAKQVFRRKSRYFTVQMFETTIFEKWSLILAFSKGLLKLSPKSIILDQQLQGFAEQLNSQTVLLLDENALLFGQYFQDKESYEICQIVSPHLATMADKVIKHGATFDLFQVKMGGGAGWVFFRDISIEDKRFYLIAHNTKADNIRLIDENLPQFEQKVTNTIKSFFI
ncbi:MAG: hypothetical protein HWN66_17705 [Candidatus Helarchaeota archaeon]|nr:hypothetical protein [Candidatus Helarchaeota archaeon]